MDCNVDTYVNEQFYMLVDDLWLQFASVVVTMLCLHCFENRLGRTLRTTDFAYVALNVQQARVCRDLAVRLQSAD